MARLDRSLVAAGVGALALLAGCGGEDEPAATQWADGVCSAVTDWRTTVDATIASLRDGVTDADGLGEATEAIETATQSLADDLRGLGRPETDAGQEAEAALDELAESVDGDLDAVRSAVEDVSGLSEALEAAAAVVTALSALQQDVAGAIDSLQGVDPEGELEDAFRDADACADFREG